MDLHFKTILVNLKCYFVTMLLRTMCDIVKYENRLKHLN